MVNKTNHKNTSIILCFCMVLAAFVGFSAIFAPAVSADDGWTLIDPQDNTASIKYRKLDYNPYYDGAEHQAYEFGLEFDDSLLRWVLAEITEQDIGFVQGIQTGGESSNPPSSWEPQVTLNNLKLLNNLTKTADPHFDMREVGNYHLKVQYSVYQNSHEGVDNVLTSEFELDFSILPRPIEIVIGSASKTFDGTELTQPDYTYNQTLDDGTNSLLPGDTLQVTVSGSQTAVGKSDNTAEVKVLDAEGNDVSKHYKLSVKPGTLTIIDNPQTGDHIRGLLLLASAMMISSCAIKMLLNKLLKKV